MAKHMCLQVFAGSYERTVFGYDLLEKEDEAESNYVLKAQFTNNSHIGCIKSLAASSRYLASGSTDEIINLYDLDQGVELGSLMQHDGSVTSLRFHGDSHMVSGSEDGMICVWGTQTWECMKIMKGHKDSINSIAVHPSGKLALSVSKDKTLRTWNLIKGRAAYTTNIKQVADDILWSPDGQLYAVIFNNQVDVYSIATATVCCSWKKSTRLLTACFITDRVLAVAGEGETVHILRVNEKKTSLDEVLEFKGHENRIKALRCTCACGKTSKPTEKWLFSASSDGCIKVWCLNTEKISEEPRLICSVNTRARLTCLAVREMGEKLEVSSSTSPQAKRTKDNKSDESPVKKKKRKNKP